jgi:transcription initiation factor TFIIIB Brf1 subunit/transcription initiation factor TFIIB
MNTESSYSYRQGKFWCHNCSQQFSRLINEQERSEVLCSRCQNVCEEILPQHGSEARNFIPYSQNDRADSSNHHPNEFNGNENNSGSYSHSSQANEERAGNQSQGPNDFRRVFITTVIFPDNSGEIPFIPFNPFFGGLFFNFHNLFNVGRQTEENNNPPADKSVVANLKEIVVDTNNENEIKEKECPICQENFKLKDVGKELKCNHLFHKECIEKWLDLHSSCPCCRGVVA